MLALAFAVAGLAQCQPPIGFVSHYPLIQRDDGQYAESGATIALVRAPWGIIQATPEAWDPSILDAQLQWARDEGIRLLYVIECGPAHSVNWIRDRTRAAGQMAIGHEGSEGDPSIFSPVYVEAMDHYIRRVVAEIRERDTAGVVYGYCNGCEWWYPSDWTFGELDRAAFERAMVGKYGSRERARAAWGLAEDGPIERPPVVFDGIGDRDSLGTLVPIDALVDASWCNVEDAHVAVSPGESYILEADVAVSNRTHGSAGLQVAWLGQVGPQPVRIDSSPRVAPTQWERLRIEAVAPPGSDRAWLHLKSFAAGDVRFRDVSFRKLGSLEELAPNGSLDPEAGGWRFIPWIASQREALESAWTPGVLETRYHPRPDATITAAWVDDWFEFMGDAVAEFIGHLADVIREADPDRPVVTYLTMSFAAPFNWDYNYAYNIHPEKVFRARRYEGLGMQTAAADGDYHHVTAAVDMVRHLGEPWLIDLQDFTSGVAIGSEAMTRTTLAGIAAGSRGVVYYCWWGTPDYDFLGAWLEGQLEAMVGAGRELLEEHSGTTVPVDVAVVHPKVPPFGGRGERDPARLMLLYKALRRLGLGVLLVSHASEAPPGVPVLSVDDLPSDMHPQVRRSTEAGNTPPMFKFASDEGSVNDLAVLLARRLGVLVPDVGTELFPRVGPDGRRTQVSVP